MNRAAKAMLEAHVQYELQKLSGEAFEKLVREEVSALFGWFGSSSLNDVATPEQIVAVIERRAIEFRIGGGITELAGEMSNQVFTSPHNETTRLQDIVPYRAFEEMVDKVAGLEQARAELIHRATSSGACRTLVASVLESSVLGILFPSDSTRNRFLLAHVGSRIVRRVVPDLELHVAVRLSRLLEKNAESIAREGEKHLLQALDRATLRRAAEELWEELAPMRLSQIFAQIEGYDLEDFVVMGYEFWLKFRRTEYFHEIVRQLVLHFFAKYGTQTLLSLIEDMGVTQTMVETDVCAFARPVFAHACKTGFLERRIRAHLEPFYASKAVEAIVARRGNSPRRPRHKK